MSDILIKHTGATVDLRRAMMDYAAAHGLSVSAESVEAIINKWKNITKSYL